MAIVPACHIEAFAWLSRRLAASVAFGSPRLLDRDPVQFLFALAIFVLPFGTAILAGALTERAGPAISGACSVTGLAAGIWLFSRVMTALAL